MQLNLPILETLAESKNILIAGAGTGFDVFIGLPLYFTLKASGKNVHLANFSSVPVALAAINNETCQELVKELVVGVNGHVKHPVSFFPEGYLAQWFAEVQGDPVTIWMFEKSGVQPLIEAYTVLVEHLGIDAILMVDGGVDSLMRGNEESPGTVVEDSISLGAISALNVPVKLLACLGFGAEVEESLCHHHALENMAALAKQGGFLGSCALTAQMEAFQLYEAACRYVWEQPNHEKSHISTRVIPAVHGEFGNFSMYPGTSLTRVMISLLMSLYWFFDANAVIERNVLIQPLMQTQTTMEAFHICTSLRRSFKLRPRQQIPY